MAQNHRTGTDSNPIRIQIDENRYPVADIAVSFHRIVAKLNHPMWSDSQRLHAMACKRIHIGAERCHRLDTPDNAGVR